MARYSAKELTVLGGEEGEAIQVLDGWVFVRLSRGEEGWLPEGHFFKEASAKAGLEGSPWSIEVMPDTAGPGCDLLRQWLREFNLKANPAFMARLDEPVHQARPLVLLATVDGKVVAGLFAETCLSWLRISIMAVDPVWRSRGIGAGLLQESMRQGAERGCRQAYVDTMEYQAPGFYQSRGFTIVGRIDDWDSHGHAKLFLTKRLD